MLSRVPTKINIQFSFYEILCEVLTHDRMRELTDILGLEFYKAIEIIGLFAILSSWQQSPNTWFTHERWVADCKLFTEESSFDLIASPIELRMGDKIYTFDDYDCFECFQFKCQANACPHHIGTGFGARESGARYSKNCHLGLFGCAVCSNLIKFTLFGERFIQNNLNHSNFAIL